LSRIRPKESEISQNVYIYDELIRNKANQSYSYASPPKKYSPFKTSSPVQQTKPSVSSAAQQQSAKPVKKGNNFPGSKTRGSQQLSKFAYLDRSR